MTETSFWQPSLLDFGTPLSDVTFVVVDLETNGLPSHDAGITEIGAVKVRGGEVLGEFQTLVNPGSEIPPFITLLTGISTAMVADAPELSMALPSFMEWAGDSVFVAHNAGFDISFLRAGSERIGIDWPNPKVLDTLQLAKGALLPDEVPNRKLSTLAAHFNSPTEPVHRALADARATVHVLHALFERLGSSGVTTLEEALDLGVQINPARRKKRSLAADLPERPGVYVFRDNERRPLYVGKSGNIRGRALTYFTRSENRDRMGRMVDLAASITAIECATELEASVRELRLIQESKPPFNRAGMYAQSNVWLRLTREQFPRLSAVRAVRPELGSLHFGPVRNLEQAALVIDAVTSLIGLRTCSQRLKRDVASPSCALAEMGRCSAPCELRVDPETYGHLVEQFVAAANGSSMVEDQLRSRIASLSKAQRYEEAALNRDRLTAWLHAANQFHRLSPLAALPELLAAAPTASGWDLHAFRYGYLAGAAQVSDAQELNAAAQALAQTATVVATPAAPAPAGTLAEARMLSQWLLKPGVRVIGVDGTWASNWPSQLAAAEELRGLQESRQQSQLAAPVRKNARFTAPR